MIPVALATSLQTRQFCYGQANTFNVFRAGCMDIRFYGFTVLAVGKRWTDRAGKLDFYLQETLPAAHKCNEQPVTLEGKHHAGT